MENPINTDALIKARGLRTQESVAAELGLSRQQLANYERGRSVPPVKMLVRIAAVYGTSLDHLLMANGDGESAATV